MGWLNEEEAGIATICQVKPALTMAEQLGRGMAGAWTERVDRYWEGAKRVAVGRRQPVKKAGEVSVELLKRMVQEVAEPAYGNAKEVNVIKLRTVFRVTIIYFTFCRGSDLQHLQARHFKRIGEDIEVTFPKSKNDQLHKGQVTHLKSNETAFCPVKVTKLYFKRMGFEWGDEGDDRRFVHCRFQKSGGWFKPAQAGPASMSKAREELTKLLRSMGVDPTGITEKSFKMLGVTATLEAGATSEEVAMQGRWHSTDMPLRYKHNSAEFKTRLASLVPI